MTAQHTCDYCGASIEHLSDDDRKELDGLCVKCGLADSYSDGRQEGRAEAEAEGVDGDELVDAILDLRRGVLDLDELYALADDPEVPR